MYLPIPAKALFVFLVTLPGRMGEVKPKHNQPAAIIHERGADQSQMELAKESKDWRLILGRQSPNQKETESKSQKRSKL